MNGDKYTNYARYEYDEAYRTLRIMTKKSDNWRRDSNASGQASVVIGRAYGKCGDKAIDSLNNRDRPVKIGKSHDRIQQWFRKQQWDARRREVSEFIAHLEADRKVVLENASERA